MIDFKKRCIKNVRTKDVHIITMEKEIYMICCPMTQLLIFFIKQKITKSKNTNKRKATTK
jgi:hypothetical protein